MSRRISALAALGGILLGAVFAVQVGQKLVVNGSEASKDVRIIGGRAFVPLADVAKALDYKISKIPGGFELVKEGGAGPIAQTHVGKLGDEIFTGKWKFTVLSFERVAEADPEFLPNEAWNRRTAGPGADIVVIKCAIKNATKAKDTIVLDKWEDNNTVLADLNQNTFEPTQHGYDAKMSEHFPDGATFLPGAAIHFNLRFEVPKSSMLKALVFTVIRYEDRSKTKSVKPTDIRVVLGD